MREEFQRCRKLCLEWLSHAQGGDALLAETAAALRDRDRLLNLHEGVALVLEDDSVKIVHWVGKFDAAMMSRIVPLDEHSPTRLTYATDLVSPKRSFRDIELLHPNAGVRMNKPRIFRQHLPKNMLLLKSMHERLLDGERTSPLGICHVCEAPTLDRDTSLACVLCGLFFHEVCCHTLRAWVEANKLFSDACFTNTDWHIEDWPRPLREVDSTYLCLLCSAVHSIETDPF